MAARTASLHLSMARLPLTTDDISEPSALLSDLRARRNGQLLEVERMMLHSPAMAIAWNGFFGGIKNGMELSPLLRELIACVVGILNSAHYQYRQHAAPFLAGGGNAAQLEALRDPDRAVHDASLFNTTERAVLQMSLEMTRYVKVTDATFAAAQAALCSHRAVVEMTGVIAGYNLVSRFLVALEIGADQGG